jgi:hypothetical protein
MTPWKFYYSSWKWYTTAVIPIQNHHWQRFPSFWCYVTCGAEEVSLIEKCFHSAVSFLKNYYLLIRENSLPCSLSQLDRIISQLNPVETLVNNCFKIYFNIIPLYSSRYPNNPLLLRNSEKNLVWHITFSFIHASYMSHPPILIYLTVLILVGEAYNYEDPH